MTGKSKIHLEYAQAHNFLIYQVMCYVRGNVTLCCDKPGYDWSYLPQAAEKCGNDLMTCGFDLIDKSEEP